MLGLRRLKLDSIWLEILPATSDRKHDQDCIRSFQRQLRTYGLTDHYCILYQSPAGDSHDLAGVRCIGISKRELIDRIKGPNTLLNLSNSIHPPFLLEFQRRIFCDIDPSEVFYWMTKLEMGQSHHHEFWTIGLNVNRQDCKLPKSSRRWRTFYPLVDTKSVQAKPLPRIQKFTTIGQWYWGGAVEVDGDFPDLSKQSAFEKFIELPTRFPRTQFELAMNISEDDPERRRLRVLGWNLIDPHRVARTARLYRRYIASATAEFTAIKGVDVAWRTGWISDRAAMFMALGRPVITEDTGAARYLPEESGMLVAHDLESATEATTAVMANQRKLSRAARACAVEIFDSAKNLRKILSL